MLSSRHNRAIPLIATMLNYTRSSQSRLQHGKKNYEFSPLAKGLLATDGC